MVDLQKPLEELKAKAWMHYAIDDYIDILKRRVRVPRCDKYSDYALSLPVVWFDDVEKLFSSLKAELKTRVLEIDKPSNDYGEVCKQNREYRRLLENLLEA